MELEQEIRSQVKKKRNRTDLPHKVDWFVEGEGGRIYLLLKHDVGLNYHCGLRQRMCFR